MYSRVTSRKIYFWIKRYGWVYSFVILLGRKCRICWHFLGPFFTKKRIEHWGKINEGLLINLGSGSNRIEGMLNADVSPYADVYLDISREFPINESSADGIFCEEVIEHLDFLTAYKMLNECFRALRPRGVMRISTPDMSYLNDVSRSPEIDNSYVLDEGARFLGRRNVDAEIARMGFVNSMFYFHEHKCLYNAGSMRKLLEEIGYEAINTSTYRADDSILGKYDSHADRYGHPPEMSIYIECRKP